MREWRRWLCRSGKNRLFDSVQVQNLYPETAPEFRTVPEFRIQFGTLNTVNSILGTVLFGARRGTRTPTLLRALDPESSASTNSAILARSARRAA